MVANQHPLQRAPAQASREKTLHGPIAAPFVGPASQAPHRHPTGHRQHRFGNPTELADGGPIQTLAETSEKHHNIRHGRLLLVERWGGGSIFYTVLNRPASFPYGAQPLCFISNFGEGIVNKRESSSIAQHRPQWHHPQNA